MTHRDGTWLIHILLASLFGLYGRLDILGDWLPFSEETLILASSTSSSP